MIEAKPIMLDLISVHVPKCGGVSLRVALKQIFGSGLLLDYDDHVTDPSSPINLDPDGWLKRQQNLLPQHLLGKRAVHGHFHHRKYKAITSKYRTAVIREPVTRLLSHYFYWQSMPRGSNTLHRYVLDNQLSLDDFARLPMVRYFYTRVYFCETVPGDFDFIGAFEVLPKAIATIGQGIGRAIDLEFENRNESALYHETLADLQNNKARFHNLARLLEQDIRFYEDCRSKWG